MNKALFAGSFDPITNGHLDIIKRASLIFDEVVVLISYNVDKNYVFSQEERLEMVNKAIDNLDNVSAFIATDLTVREAKKYNANVLIRGIRDDVDYAYEMNMAKINKQLDPSLETMCFFASSETKNISSSEIKKLVSEGKDITNYVPSELVSFIISKLK